MCFNKRVFLPGRTMRSQTKARIKGDMAIRWDKKSSSNSIIATDSVKVCIGQMRVTAALHFTFSNAMHCNTTVRNSSRMTYVGSRLTSDCASFGLQIQSWQGVSRKYTLACMINATFSEVAVLDTPAGSSTASMGGCRKASSYLTSLASEFSQGSALATILWTTSGTVLGELTNNSETPETHFAFASDSVRNNVPSDMGTVSPNGA
mmetsp:Transcript_112975/g.319545  ORF Transcript_112975/g.319545 Transcript_112975/m.319545 type:complete len:206 (-) Transcript_112975:282-899(-)